MNRYFSNWQEVLPMIGLGAIVSVGLYFVFRKKPENSDEMERQRRAYLNRIGRIIEGQVVEVSDQSVAQMPLTAHGSAKAIAATPAIVAAPRLLYYAYCISGVTYETAQDVTGLEEQAQLSRVVAGQHASVKYDPSNPSNSILLADDWSGLH